MGGAKSKPVRRDRLDSNSSGRGIGIQEGLVRERDKKHDLAEIYEVIAEIGHGGLCTVYKVEKKAEYIGGSSRPQNVRKKRVLGDLKMSMTSNSMPALLMREDSGAGDSTEEKPTDASSSPIIRRADSRSYSMYFALKVINLALVKEDKIDQLANEVELLKTLDHKNIIKAFETFTRKKNIMIIMELCTGGDLNSRMPYTELEVARVTTDILSAVKYIHTKCIVHRDIKMENIMFESQHPEAAVKVIDFGLSKEYSPQNHILTERVGTLYSMSPETMQGVYTTQADLWSIGVCTYIMLCNGKAKPFEGKTPKQVVANVLTGRYNFDGQWWEPISTLAKAFISALLVVKPVDRLTAAQAINHEWLVKAREIAATKPAAGLQESLTLSSSSPTEDFKNRVRESIVAYADMGEFRKLALNVIAKKSSSHEIFELRKVFDEFDTTHTGTITFEEFKVALAQFDYSEEDITTIFHKVDVNKNDEINYTEFLAAALETQGYIEEFRLAEAFDLLDCDDSGYISRSNLRTVLGDRGTDEAYIKKLIAEADFKGDGRICYEEFLQLFAKSKRDSVRNIYEDGNFDSSHSTDEILRKHGILETLRRGLNSQSGNSLARNISR